MSCIHIEGEIPDLKKKLQCVINETRLASIHRDVLPALIENQIPM